VVANVILGILAGLSVVLLLWQWAVAARFPLHQRSAAHAFPPAVTLLKPLKGADASTEDCLRSWLKQDYTGRVQVLFGVASAEDPACGIVRRLLAEFPDGDAQLVICGPLLGANAKVSKLVELEEKARHEIVVVSDADVRVPPDFLANLVESLRQPEVGLVNCFYRLANPSTLAMHYEALAVNADFWSQVLQGQSLKPLDFALGAVMATRRKQLAEMGGFRALVDCLADDYQLGNRIARLGHGIALCPVVVECWEKPMGWVAVWKHQLRWARTIRVCQPAPYFFSVLSNPTLWPLLWVVVRPGPWSIACMAVALIARVAAVFDLQRRLNRSWSHARFFWLTPLKDLLQAALWLAAFSGNRVEWRGERLRLRSDGTLVRS
jgi:ceramide glucosyltransferase